MFIEYEYSVAGMQARDELLGQASGETLEPAGVMAEAVEQGNLLQRLDELRQHHPFAATAVETTLVWAGREVLTGVVNEHTALRIGHGWKNGRLGRAFGAPLVAIGLGMVVGPHAEEYLCRERPSRYLDDIGRAGLQPRIGIGVAAVFAAGHAGREALPVPQFIGGLNYWRLQRTRGFKHAVLAHVIHNGLAYGAGVLSGKDRALHR